jgi:hypothetical protein
MNKIFEVRQKAILSRKTFKSWSGRRYFLRISTMEFLITYEWLQTSVQTCKRTTNKQTNGQVNLNKKVSKNKTLKHRCANSNYDRIQWIEVRRCKLLPKLTNKVQVSGNRQKKSDALVVHV